jgi:predicted tellurium resistance membrane protein TerC
MPDFLAWMTTPQGWMSLATLAILEIVLGIDNVIFISIAASRLPREQQQMARRVGLFLALFLRIALLSILVWLAKLSEPVFTILGHGVSWRDIILIVGGLYLLWKATIEIDDMVRAKTTADHAGPKRKAQTMFAVIAQIAVIDVIFALDSMITAVGMTNDLPIMIVAVVMAVLVMMFASDVISDFIDRYPTIKMLALAFLMIVGMVLVADGCGFHIPREYLYAAIAFSIGVEALNIAARKAGEKRQSEEDAGDGAG